MLPKKFCGSTAAPLQSMASSLREFVIRRDRFESPAEAPRDGHGAAAAGMFFPEKLVASDRSY
jgi:hypothetical protein